jgi:hypothetical protein
MIKIQDSSELSKYYHKISECLDDYILKHNVKPTEIWSYIKKNFDRFLEKYNLVGIENIDKIINDVIDHRRHMELDKVFYFENFISKIDESFLQSEPPTIQHEKVLADFFETSVGHVEVLESNLHLYRIKSLGEDLRAIIFSNSELDSMKENVLQKLINKIYSTEISINSLGGIGLNFDMKFPLSELIPKDQIKIKELSDVQFFRIISKILESSFDMTNYSGKVSFYRSVPQKFKDYYIWEVRTS